MGNETLNLYSCDEPISSGDKPMKEYIGKTITEILLTNHRTVSYKIACHTKFSNELTIESDEYTLLLWMFFNKLKNGTSSKGKQIYLKCVMNLLFEDGSTYVCDTFPDLILEDTCKIVIHPVEINH